MKLPARLNPFAKLDRGREVFAWGMYDLANQSFQLLIKTLLFSLYVQKVVGATEPKGKALWTAMTASSMLLVALLSPIMGAIADRKAWRREMLMVSGLIGATLTACLAIVGPGDAILAFALYVVAALACGLGENFLAAFLPEISTQKNIGYVSAVGWTMSYVGALLLLIITAIYSVALHHDQPSEFRPVFVFSGLWFLGGMIPAFLWLRERTPPTGGNTGSAVIGALKQMAQSAKETRRFRQLFRFFTAFFAYNLGTLAVFNFLSIIADGMHFSLGDTLLFALVVAATAGFTSFATAAYQDRLGHKRTIMAFLGFWVVAMLGMAGSQYFHAPPWTFWIISATLGLALGGLGTASRALVGSLTPAHRSAEFFGVWGLVNQISGILGVVAFGQVTLLVKPADLGQVVGLLMLAAFFGIGFLLILRVDTAEGLRTARQAEAEKGISDVPGVCAQCGYSRAGSADGPCPECGSHPTAQPTKG